MTEQQLSPQEATHGEEVVLPHDPPPPPGWIDPLEGTAVAEVAEEPPAGDGDAAGA